MSSMFLFIVITLMVLAISGLVVGVANDAVNFLNSALGSKAAPRKVILGVASIGILVGALTSSGMMEVARSGVFYPEAFTFQDVMLLFLGVMFANVILLDLFNTFGLPTSTTVSLVFGLLGAAVATAALKIAGDDTLTAANLSQFINSGKAMVIVSAILLSVAVAFVSGTLVQFVTRLLFTFHYSKVFKRLGAVWCGFAFTAIVYFALIKGLKSSGLLSPEFLELINSHLAVTLLVVWAASSILMAVLQFLFKANILKITILAGTFSLALAFAGNDLVNFIGVPIAGYDSYKIFLSTGSDPGMLMGALNRPATANFLILLIAGTIMVVTLWFSKKAQSVSDTEINLAKQEEGVERFGSTFFSRSIVRMALNFNHWYEDHTPERLQKAINKRFIPLRMDPTKERAPYDMIRATVNLTLASILISVATSWQLPLSTTYVTFMVAMGSSLADKAWGRESAVYRITGVLTVISGWFVTALIAFVIAFVVTVALIWGETIAVIVITVLCALMLVKSNAMHKKRERKNHSQQPTAREEAGDKVLERCVEEVCETMQQVTNIYQETIQATLKEDRKTLRNMVRQSNELFYQARERKYQVLPTLQLLKDNAIETGHYYVQVVDYMSELTKSLVHITRPCFDHIDNNHRGMSEEQVHDLLHINEAVSDIYARINHMLRSNDFSQLDLILQLRDELFETIAEAIKRQLKRIQSKTTSTKASLLYLTILNETKTMVLQSRNLLKSQRYFLENTKDRE